MLCPKKNSTLVTVVIVTTVMLTMVMVMVVMVTIVMVVIVNQLSSFNLYDLNIGFYSSIVTCVVENDRPILLIMLSPLIIIDADTLIIVTIIIIIMITSITRVQHR